MFSVAAGKFSISSTDADNRFASVAHCSDGGRLFMRSSAVTTEQNFCARFAALRPVELKSARREQLRASLRRKELFLSSEAVTRFTSSRRRCQRRRPLLKDRCEGRMSGNARTNSV
jgi:hypothetical protein